MKLYYSHKELYLPILGVPLMNYDYRVLYKKTEKNFTTNKIRKFTEEEFDKFIECCREIMFSKNMKMKTIYYKFENISPHFQKIIKKIPKCIIHFAFDTIPQYSYARFYYKDSVFSVKNSTYLRTETVPLGNSFIKGKEDSFVYDELIEHTMLLKMTGVGKVSLTLGIHGLHYEQVANLSKMIMENKM